jgi:hypothetical protein
MMLAHCSCHRVFGRGQPPCGWDVAAAGASAGDAAAVPGPDAARAGLAFASPGSVNAATVRHAPAAAYNLERKKISPAQGDRAAAGKLRPRLRIARKMDAR